jgi:nitrate/TMAO reductase-like tetraheme cytochrome c subunit
MQSEFNVLCPPAARQQSVASCDNMSVIFPFPVAFVSMSNVSVLGFRCRYLHLPIDFLERLKP